MSNIFRDVIETRTRQERKTLVQWLEHVAGIGSPIEIKLLNGGTHTIEASPHYFTDCETCKQIAEYLAQYHGESGQ
jgi:hypothetical protein